MSNTNLYITLKKRVKRLERKKKSKTSGLKRLRRVGADQRVESSSNIILGVEEDTSKWRGGKEIASIDADKGITLVDVETDEEEVALDAEDEQERADNEEALELQRQLDEREDDIDWSTVAKQVKERQPDSIKRYQYLKKKPVSVAQAKKNMMIYLKNMAGYKIKFFKGMTYDEIRPIFERQYNKIQTLFKQDKDVQKTKKKRVADEILLQESFKKVRAAEVSRFESTQEIPTDDLKEITKEDVQNMLEIVLVPKFRFEALQGVETSYPPTTVEEKLARKNELKSRGDRLKVADGNVDYESQKIPTKNRKESRASKHQDNRNNEAPRRTVPVKETTSNALVSQELHAPKPDLVFANEHVVSESVTSLPGIAKSKVKTSETKFKNVSAPIIEDWVSDSKDEDEIKPESKQIKPSFAEVKFVKPTKHVKSPRKSIKLLLSSTKVNAASSRVTAADRDTTAGWIKTEIT
nr:hypothetical protein [Tanacetum cinerariifolium]